MSQELENTFLTAIEKNQQKLLRICSVYSKDTKELKVLFQEVLIHIWECMSSFDETKSSLEKLMLQVTHNVCLRLRMLVNEFSNSETQAVHYGQIQLQSFLACPLFFP